MNTSNLFKEMAIGKLTIKNRFVMPAMDSGTTLPDHTFSDHSIAYYTARAQGGFGLLITEYLAVSRQGLGNSCEVAVWDDSFIPNLKKLSTSVHQAEGLIFGQIHHIGIMGKSINTKEICVGPSPIAANNIGEPTRELSNQEVYKIIDDFGNGALRLKNAGFDGCEIHAAHGYLIAQFLSRATNKRVDEFGGSYENRFRIAELIIQNIKQKCGHDFPVSFRFNTNEFIEHGNNLIDARIYAQMAEKAGADCLHISNGTGQGGYIAAPHYFQQAYNIDNIAEIKKEVHIPVIAVGRISDPAVAEYIINTQKADFIALGRASICDPQFPNKIKDNRTNEIFQCTGCLQRCWYSGGCESDDTGVSCMMNPFSGKEDRWILSRTKNPKHYIIIGAGPAGLECAWILAKRGHKVQVYEKENFPGGSYRLAAIPPHKQDLAKTIHTYISLCERYGVKIHYQIEVDAKFLTSLHCDGIILATGSQPFLPPISGLHSSIACKANDILKGEKVIVNKKVIVLGGGLVGCEIAEILSWYKNDVTIVEMKDSLASEAVPRSRAVLLERLSLNHVKVLLHTMVTSISEEGIEVQKQKDKPKIIKADNVVIALGSRSYNPLEENARLLFDNVYVVGDAKMARDAKMAIYESAKLAKDL